MLKRLGSVTGALAISGCLVGDDSSPVTPPEERDRPCWETVDGEQVNIDPVFSVADQDEMVLPEDEILSVYEKFDDPDYPTYDAYIDTRDYSNTILLKVKVYADVEDAVEHYEENKAAYESPNNFSIGDEAVRQDDGDYAEMTMRISNAIGHVISYVPEQAPEDPADRTFPPRTRVSRYARRLHDWWGGTSDFRKEPGFCREEILEETKAG